MGTMARREFAFREQRPWGALPRGVLVLAGIICLLVVVVPFARGTYQQLILGRPWGDRPMPDGVLWVVGPAAILLGLLPWLLLGCRMTVEVGDGRVWVFLLGKKAFDLSEVTAVAIDHASPLIGWGVRWAPGRLYYRVGSAAGVSLTLRSGRVVFIESSRPNELVAAIQAGMSK